MTKINKINLGGIEFVTAQELANIYGCSYQTVQNAIHGRTKNNSFVLDGKIKGFYKGANRWLIPFLDIPTMYRRQYEQSK